MVSVDGFFMRKDLAGTLRVINRLEGRVGGDPYLDFLRANAYQLDPTPEHLAAAEQAARNAVAGMPDDQNVLFALLTVLVRRKDYPAALPTLDTLAQKFDVGIDTDQVAGDADWDAFLASADYASWLAKQ